METENSQNGTILMKEPMRKDSRKVVGDRLVIGLNRKELNK